MPFVIEGQAIGALEFAASLSQIERQTQRIILISLATIGAISIVLIIVAYMTGLHWIGRPLEALMEKAERIGRGDFSRPIDLNRNDELGSLGTSLNQMCQRLGTPLNVIGGRATMIVSGKLSDEQTRESATAIKSETDHIAMGSPTSDSILCWKSTNGTFYEWQGNVGKHRAEN